nr:ribonuclease H-like domain-containing protein [Tanacetum cinerariifolium]
MSSMEAEYVSLSACCAQVIWMRMQLLDYGFRFNKISINCDSKSAISISCNLFCGNEAHVGYNCPVQVSYVQTLPSFPQQSPCCEDSEVTHEPYQCQPKNHDYYNEQDSCFDSNSFGFDQSQPQQYTVNHPIFNAHNDYLDSQIQLNSTLAKITEQMTSITSLCEIAYDNIIYGLPPFSAITPDEPVLSTEEPDNSLSMGDEHLDTIPATESDEFIKSSVENLIPIPKFSSIDDDSFSLDNIDYVEASPLDSKLVISEVMEIIIPEVGGIEASNDNPIPFYDPIIFRTPPNLTSSGESDFFLE